MNKAQMIAFGGPHHTRCIASFEDDRFKVKIYQKLGAQAKTMALWSKTENRLVIQRKDGQGRVTNTRTVK